MKPEEPDDPWEGTVVGPLDTLAPSAASTKRVKSVFCRLCQLESGEIGPSQATTGRNSHIELRVVVAEKAARGVAYRIKPFDGFVVRLIEYLQVRIDSQSVHGGKERSSEGNAIERRRFQSDKVACGFTEVLVDSLFGEFVVAIDGGDKRVGGNAEFLGQFF